MASRGRMQARSRVQLVEGQIRWVFRSLPKVRCLAAMLHLVFLLVEWRINCDVSFACLLLTGDCSRNSKSYRWYLESRQGFENRGISNALKIERPHSRSEWAIGRWGHVLIRILGVFFRSSGGGAVMLSCFALTPHYLSHTKTDGPIRGIADYKTTRIWLWGGGCNIVLNCLK